MSGAGNRVPLSVARPAGTMGFIRPKWVDCPKEAKSPYRPVDRLRIRAAGRLGERVAMFRRPFFYMEARLFRKLAKPELEAS